jgi:hypothetical protein
MHGVASRVEKNGHGLVMVHTAVEVDVRHLGFLESEGL